MTGQPPPSILLVEDDQVEQRMIARAFRQRRAAGAIRFADDGVAALQILRGTGGEEPLERPYIIILDLDLPRMDGHQFLRELRQDPALASAVVFVRTTSRSPEDRAAAYARHVAGYIPKTDAPRALDEVIDLIEGYGRVVELP